MISAKSLVKTYELGGSVIRALDGVDLDVAAGDMLAITGPSGSGKSTLMNVLGCLDRPDEGDYYLAGEDVAGLSEDRLAEIRNRRIGFVFQTFNLLPRMSALENVALPLAYGDAEGQAPRKVRPALRGVADDTRGRAERALATVGLAERMKHEPNQLSGGERQRVAVARALVMDPAIILADEPTGNLDSRTGEDLLALFAELNEAGRTFLIVTHDPDVAGDCSREVHMRDGRIVDARG